MYRFSGYTSYEGDSVPLTIQRDIDVGLDFIEKSFNTGFDSKKEDVEVGSASKTRGIEFDSSSKKQGTEVGSPSKKHDIEVGSASKEQDIEVGSSSTKQDIEVGSASKKLDYEVGSTSKKQVVEIGSASKKKVSEVGSVSKKQNIEVGSASVKQDIDTDSAPIKKRKILIDKNPIYPRNLDTDVKDCMKTFLDMKKIALSFLHTFSIMCVFGDDNEVMFYNQCRWDDSLPRNPEFLNCLNETKKLYTEIQTDAILIQNLLRQCLKNYKSLKTLSNGGKKLSSVVKTAESLMSASKRDFITVKSLLKENLIRMYLLYANHQRILIKLCSN